jgi:hypothetical protein
MTWSMRTLVSASTVCTVNGMPPQANAALIFASVLPLRPSCDFGTCAQVSRGIDTSCALDRSWVRCARMMVSLREPELLAGSRESLPRTRKFNASFATFSGRDSFGTESNACTRSMSPSTDR